jgi:hypothetical protein
VARRPLDGLGEGLVTPPFTAQPLDALMAAQTSAGLVLGSMLWLRRWRPAVSTVIFGFAVACTVLAPVAGDFLKGIGLTTTPWEVVTWLKMALAAATVASLVTSFTTRRWALGVVAVFGAYAMWEAVGYITSSDGELAVAVLAFLGLLIGIQWRLLPATPAPPRPDSLAPHPRQRPLWVDDAAAFVLGTLGGAVVCRVVLHGWTGSGDEWADTYQAALFAKFHAYGVVPHCSEAFRAFWVFQYMGRTFAQYTPGWPFFMAPFVALHAVSLAGPASLGLLAAGIGRLARRGAAGFSKGTARPQRDEVRSAGRFAIALTLLSSTVLINGGSRYPHIFVAAMFAWSIEALLTISTGATGTPGTEGTACDLSNDRQWSWGAVLGGCTSLMLAARPGDGLTLGFGLFLYFVYALVRWRFRWRSLAGAAAVFAFVIGLTLVVLRLQLGKWFTTGYSLTEVFYPWAKVAWSWPKPDEYKWGIPLATGSYCWWPCAPAIGLAGIAALRGRARRMGFIFFFGVLPFVAFYTASEFGRGFALGYGPRYALPIVVPMAVGGGVVFAQLWTYARSAAVDRSALAAAGPAALAITAVLLAVLRIAPLVYPYTFTDVQNHNRLNEAIAKAGLQNAIVFANMGFSDTDPMDLPENLPLELYPNQDVLIAVDHNPDENRCVRRMNPSRRAYRAVPGYPVRIVPE